MASTTLSSENRLKRVITSHYFWIVAVTLAVSAFFHYFTPQIRFLPLASFPITRHSIERIIFILPVAGAAFAFGQTGGLVTLAIAVLIMLPRVLLFSPYTADALLETVGVAVIGYLVIWMIEIQEREKRLRQEAASRLEVLNTVYALITQSLERKQILDNVLDRILGVMRVEAAWVYLLDERTQELVFEAHRGLSGDLVAAVGRLKVGEGLNGQVAQSGKPLLVDNASEAPGATREVVQREGLQALFVVPLRSKDKVMGTLGVAMHGPRQFLPEEVNLLSAIGNQISVAIENAHLYENMRFYARQITRAQEDERKRIARELHDDTAQALVNLSRRLDDLATSPEPLSESAIGHLEEFQELIDDILRGVRRFSRDLRPSVLDDLGLLPALEGLTANLMEGDGIEAELKVCGDRRRLSPEAELVLFRIVQEALNNVRRHSQASRVVTTVEFGEGRARPELVLSKACPEPCRRVEGQGRKVRITVDDNGRGFELPGRAGDLATAGKLGLIGMRERARLLDGTLTVRSEPGQGTTVTVDVPA